MHVSDEFDDANRERKRNTNNQKKWNDLKEVVKKHKNIHAGLKKSSVFNAHKEIHAEVEKAYTNILKEMEEMENG